MIAETWIFFSFLFMGGNEEVERKPPGFYGRETITVHASLTFQRALITTQSAEINKVATTK